MLIRCALYQDLVACCIMSGTYALPRFLQEMQRHHVAQERRLGDHLSVGRKLADFWEVIVSEIKTDEAQLGLTSRNKLRNVLHVNRISPLQHLGDIFGCPFVVVYQTCDSEASGPPYLHDQSNVAYTMPFVPYRRIQCLACRPVACTIRWR